MGIADTLATLLLSEEDAGASLKKRLQQAMSALGNATSQEDQEEYVDTMETDDYGLIKYLSEQLKTASDSYTRMLLIQLLSATVEIIPKEEVYNKIIEGGSFPIVIAECLTGKNEDLLILTTDFASTLVAKLRPLPLASRALLDHGCIVRLLEVLDEPHENEEVNKGTCRLLLSIHLQYADAIEPECYDDNLFLKTIENHPNKSLFAGLVVAMCNRGESVLDILCLLTHVFSYEGTAQSLFYTTDLQILLDVILRELHDLPEDNLQLQTSYFEVLYAIFSNTNYGQTKYRQPEFLSCLRMYQERLSEMQGSDSQEQKYISRMGSYVMCTKAVLEPVESKSISLSRKPAGQLSLSRK